jgi:hypothetical protein
LADDSNPIVAGAPAGDNDSSPSTERHP